MWVKIDDNFTDHPKIMAAGPMASWLHVCGMTYSGRSLTDGFIPRAQVRKLADVDNPFELVARLIEVGLWEEVEGGYQIHDWLEHNPSAKAVKAKRLEAAKRQAEWRIRQQEEDEPDDEEDNTVTNSVTPPVTNSDHNDCPDPTRPDHDSNNTCVSLSGEPDLDPDLLAIKKASDARVAGGKLHGQSNGYPGEFEQFWQLYPKKIDKKVAYKKWRVRLREGIKADALIKAAGNYARVKRGTDQQFIMYPQTFLGPDARYEAYLTGQSPGEPKPIVYSPSELERMQVIEQEAERLKNGRQECTAQSR